MDLHFIFAVVSMLISAAFTAGVMSFAIRVIGKGLEDARVEFKGAIEKLQEKDDAQDEKIASHAGQIGILQSQVGSLKAMRAPWASRGERKD